MSVYFAPPDDYKAPTHCHECDCLIMLTNRRNTYGWVHLLDPSVHDVVMRPEGWWDVRTGTTRHEIMVKK